MITTRHLEELRRYAIHAALEAGKVLMRYFRKGYRVDSKTHLGLVTPADLEAEKKVARFLKLQTPHFGFLGEEGSYASGKNLNTNREGKEGRWILDPLDGTTNFVHGFPMFCVSIAAEWHGEIVVGVINHPCLEDLYVATRGGGAFLNGKRITVSKSKCLKDSLVTTGFYTSSIDSSFDHDIHAFRQISLSCRGIRRPGSAALDLAYVARGVFDGFWERRLSPWDVAAGALLVSEAGGHVTDYSGGKHHIEGGEIIATNQWIYEEIHGILNREHFNKKKLQKQKVRGM